MGTILQQAQTIEEKLTGYTEGTEVDFTALDEWRNVRSLLTDKYFEEMLDVTGTSREAFAYALQSQPMSSTHVNDSWYDLFEDIVTSFDFTDEDYSDGAHTINVPFVKHFKRMIDQNQQVLNNVIVSEEVLKMATEVLFSELFQINGKLIAEHLLKYKQHHTFRSKSKKGRMKEYLINNFSTKDAYLKFFEEYPVAARLMTIRTEFFCQNFNELLQRLNEDSSDIKEFLNIPNLRLTGIDMSSGDSHSNGKSVSILHISGHKLVYKPKNLKISLAFNSFIEWITDKSKLLNIKLPNGIFKETHTYNEFIEPKPCMDSESMERYYQRYGQLIGICYLLGMNDAHFENIIASGEFPVLIDLETAFQNSDYSQSGSLLFNYLEKMIINESVLNSALLPHNVSLGIHDTVDLSGLSGKKKLLSQELDNPVSLYTDDFHFEKKKAKFQNGNNLPSINGESEVSYERYSLNIIQGFENFMNFILHLKKECLEKMSSFKDCNVRLLLKSTERYNVLIRYSNQSIYNQKMKYRERLFMNVWSYPYQDKRIIQSEVADLVMNDIPIFFAKTDSRSISDSQGNEYPEYFKKSGYDHMQDRVENLSQKDIYQQKILICSSLGIFDKQNNQRLKSEGPFFPSMYFDKEVAARSIADILMHESFERENQQSFLTIYANKQKNWRISPCDESLYSGLSGMAVFFLELYQVTKEKRYLDTYKKVLQTAIYQSKFTKVTTAFSGKFSPLYPIILGYKYLGETNKYVEDLFRDLSTDKDNFINNLNEVDYLSGLAGIVRLFCMLEDEYPSVPCFADVKNKLYSRFVDKYHKEVKYTPVSAGIAHGGSGIALALASLKTDYESEIVDLLKSEFSARIVMKDRKKWCRGLSGMIQARIDILEKYPNVEIEKQVKSLIQQFKHITKRMVNKDCLCHGNGGLIVTIKMIAQQTNDPYWNDLLQLWLSNLYMGETFNKAKLPEILNLTTKGIFDGLSGIGWVYLYGQTSISNIMLLKSESCI
ncbi:type 2 lanthipeptide synthetase LanM [Enterococcus sp.]|uniref:type 2 lanthipeptide synthetase LanM n=1 Tax=Enterococcus sp. TaxID=35783 RepID=UPI0028A94A9A|nr:type 2 lanthipeptide synthetase LanM [Enterococcus sp.]